MRNIVLFLAVLLQTAYSKDYVIGVEDVNYFPIYNNDNGQYKGYARDLFDKFAKDSGHNFTYNILPVNRLFKALAEGQVDFKFPDNEHWQKDAKQGVSVSYTNGVFTNIDGCYVLKENLGNKLENIKTLGTLLGFTPWPYFDNIQKGAITLSHNPNLVGLISQGTLKRIDCVYLSGYVIESYLKQENKIGALVFNKNLPYSKDEYKLSTTKEVSVINAFNEWLSKNQEFVNSLKAKYGIDKDLEK
jgi:hypothetical protein